MPSSGAIFTALAAVTELDSNLMHAVMMTSDPPLYYWLPGSLAIMKAVKAWQSQGMAGHLYPGCRPQCACDHHKPFMGEVLRQLRQFAGVIDVLSALPVARHALLPLDSPSQVAQV
jgi:diphosphomevalonate decarboxylase